MSDSRHYVIRGGVEGRERLRVIARVMRASSMSMFDRLGLRDGCECLDVGCGGGDVTLDLARRVGPHGRVVGVDIDERKLDIARTEARQLGVANVEFRVADVRDEPKDAAFDVVYSRFLLTHLSDPAAAVRAFHRQLRPGGILGVEDIDFTGSFTYPESKAFRRFHELYCATVTRRGGDPNIGPRLPGLVKHNGFDELGVWVAQPIATHGDAKLINPLTMQNIGDAVLQDGLASREEIDEVVRDLFQFAADPDTVAGTPRVVQVLGRRATDLPAAAAAGSRRDE